MRQRPEIERQSLLVDDQGAGLGQNMSYVDSHERAGAEQKASQIATTASADLRIGGLLVSTVGNQRSTIRGDRSELDGSP